MWSVIFPGQGSQFPGMGLFLFENFPIVRECFEEASDAIKIDMKKLCFSSSESDLALTENTQPALLLVSIATHQVLKNVMGIRAKYFAGHSVGEYAAVVAAGGMNFADAVKAVRKRGQAMQSAVPIGKGGMLAVVGPSSQEVLQLCDWVSQESGFTPISPANYNSPQQTVVSGARNAVDWLNENIKAYKFPSAPKRVLAIPLKVSAPFHCEMMKPAEDEMRFVLDGMRFRDSVDGVVQNVTAQPISLAAELKENLVKQITGSVRWVESVETLKKLGVSRFIECGAGKVLAGLNKKIDVDLVTYTTNDLSEVKLLENQL
mgnify:CR=1 FL=1